MAMADDLCFQISRIFDECCNSYNVHRRKIKEMLHIRMSYGIRFFTGFTKTLTPFFDFPRRTTSSERIIRFVSNFAVRRDEKHPAASDCFLEEFLRFLLTASNASSKNARFRSCQIISEIIMRLPDDAEVSDEIWDEVINSMKQRVEDKVPSVRTYAVRSLARFATDTENGGDIVDLFLQALYREPNPEVRKTIVLSLPPSNTTAVEVVERTLDVSESVRKAAYSVLANKFPLMRLSIKQRTTILQRGLMDRSPSVRKECINLLKDEWLLKGCGGDLVVLLRFLDVETYELVGDTVMEALLKAGVVHVHDGQSIKQFLLTRIDEGKYVRKISYMDAEVAFYWKCVCCHLQTVAQVRGSEAATTGGTEAAVYAAEASESNDLLEKILPSTVAEYVELVKAHMDAGASFRFSSRQLLLLGTMLDFSDATNRKVASAFIKELLDRPLEHEVEDGHQVLIGDGVNLGGEEDWARAVSELAKKVHASVGEFEEVITLVVEKLAQPCRERTADFLQWMHCLAVTGLLLENVKSVQNLKGMAIEAHELLHSLLIPAAKHAHMDIQRVATRCLGLFGLREKKLSEELVKQLRLSFLSGCVSVKVMAAKALLDLAMTHGPEEVDRALELDTSFYVEKMNFTLVNLSNVNGDPAVGLLDLLYSGLEANDWGEGAGMDQDTVKAVIGEGFAKILLLSKNYPSISASLHPLILARLIKLYFSNEADMVRLKQCLSVFFEHFPALSLDNKKCISSALIPVMRSMWPGINGNPGGAPMVVSAHRKRAVHASHFMLQMMQIPLYSKGSKEAQTDEKTTENVPDICERDANFESGEEGLALRIAAEVINCPLKKTAAGKSYLSALCRLALLLKFRPSEPSSIKCMRGLLTRMMESVSADKELIKELRQMGAYLQALDAHPDEDLTEAETGLIFGKLELDINVKTEVTFTPMPIQPTPAPRSTRTIRARRRLRQEGTSSDEEDVSSVCSVPLTSSAINVRSQRASKAVALRRITGDRGGRDSGSEEGKEMIQM